MVFSMQTSRCTFLIDIVLFLSFASLFATMTIKSQFIYQVVSEYHYNTTNNTLKYCRENETHVSPEDQLVAHDTSRWTMYIEVASLLPPVISSTILTSWSDKIGRKITMVIPLLGIFFNGILQTCVIAFKLSLSWMILSGLILGLSGSYFALINIGMAYVTDITVNAKRGLRYTLVAVSIGISGGMSGMGTGYWIEVQGFVPASCFAAFAIFLAIVLIPFIPVKQSSVASDLVSEVNKNSKNGTHEQSSSGEDVNPSTSISHNSSFATQMKAIWRVYTTEKSICLLCHTDSHVSSAQSCCHGGGIHKGRIWRLWLHTISFGVLMYVTVGTMSVQTMFFLSYPLCFTPSLIGIQVGIKYLTLAITPFLAAILEFVLHMSSQSIIVLGIVGTIVSMLIMYLAEYAYVVFLSTAFLLFNNLVSPFQRAEMSTLVSTTEHGSTFAMLSASESVFSLLASCTYLLIYPATYKISHWFVWIYSAFTLLIPTVLMSIVWIMNNPRNSQEKKEEEAPLLG